MKEIKWLLFSIHGVHKDVRLQKLDQCTAIMVKMT